MKEISEIEINAHPLGKVVLAENLPNVLKIEMVKFRDELKLQYPDKPDKKGIYHADKRVNVELLKRLESYYYYNPNKRTYKLTSLPTQE